MSSRTWCCCFISSVILSVYISLAVLFHAPSLIMQRDWTCDTAVLRDNVRTPIVWGENTTPAVATLFSDPWPHPHNTHSDELWTHDVLQSHLWNEHLLMRVWTFQFSSNHIQIAVIKRWISNGHKTCEEIFCITESCSWDHYTCSVQCSTYEGNIILIL